MGFYFKKMENEIWKDIEGRKPKYIVTHFPMISRETVYSIKHKRSWNHVK